MRERKPRERWLVLLAATVLLAAVLSWAQISAAALLASLVAGIWVAVLGGRVEVPAWPYRLAQGVVGCLIARNITPGTLGAVLAQWPVVVFSIVSVVLCSAALGAGLARFQVLPGSTAVWGASPGAATAMVLMAESFGADVRLVAFMQYLRVVMVALVASLVTRWWVPDMASPAAAVAWLEPVALVPLCETLAVAFVGALLGTVLEFHAGALLVPLVLAVALAALGFLTITLPAWLLWPCAALVGWTIGLRFTREIVVYVARAFPKVALALLLLIALCGGLAWVLHMLTGKDALTAYLATSPGGADSVALIAASAHVDAPFVMAMQTGRFLFVLFAGPGIARRVARWATRQGTSPS